MTMKGAPFGSVLTSNTRTTCSLWMAAAARASRRKRATAPSRDALWGARNLIATERPSDVSTAPMTTPMPPAPTTESMRYFPQTVSPGRGSPPPSNPPPPLRTVESILPRA